MDRTIFSRKVLIIAVSICFLVSLGSLALAATQKQAASKGDVKAKKDIKSASKAKSNFILPLHSMIDVNYYNRSLMPDGDWQHIIWVIEHNNKAGTITVEVNGKVLRKQDFAFEGHDSLKLKDVGAMPGDSTTANELLSLQAPPPVITFKKEAPDKAPGPLAMMKGPDTYFVALKPNSGVWIVMRQITDATLLDCPFKFDWDAPIMVGVNYADRENARATRLRHLWIEKRDVELADYAVDDKGFIKTKTFGQLEVKVPAAPPSIIGAFYFQGTCRATRPQIKKIADWISTAKPTMQDSGGVRVQQLEFR